MPQPCPTLACPLDGAPLTRHGATWRCPQGHSYDIAGEGYVNLLPVQHKRSRDPGDSKAMVTARRRFLGAGHYQPIADAVARLSLDALQPGAPATCLDAGCGEGYYLRQLATAASTQGINLGILGLDISKWAVQSAAKQDRHDNQWVVGTNARLPVLAHTVDRLLCLFGFPVYGEFARVLKPGGRLIQVDSGPRHLKELREIIYPSLKPERPTEDQTPPGFQRVGTDTISFPLTLPSQEAIADLLTMTPHLYKASAEGKTRAAALTEITLTVDAKMVVWERVERSEGN